MIIKGKRYCDVCLKELDSSANCITISGASLDEHQEFQERHYCKEHRVWYDLWYAIRNGDKIDTSDIPNLKVEKKEITSLELYDLITDTIQKYLGYTLEAIPMDRDLVECMKKNLDSEVSFNRLKVRGVIKE